MKIIFSSTETISLTTLSLLAYNNARYDTGVDITKEGLEKLKSIQIKVFSGDEIAVVKYKDGRTEWYDSAVVGGKRTEDIFDDEYILYREGDDESTVLMWLFRSDSYDKGWTGDLPKYKDLH
jgi:hypothetical protein